MGTTVPIPMGIKDRAAYAALLKIARTLARTTILSISENGSVALADDLTITNTAVYALQESVEVVTSLSFEEFNKDSVMYQFGAELKGDIGYTEGDPNLPSAYVNTTVKAPSFGDNDTNVILQMDLYVRAIDSISGSTIEWKIKKLE